MKEFINLTTTDGRLMVVNVRSLRMVYPNGTGSILSWSHHGFGTEVVRESPEEVFALLKVGDWG